MSRDPSRGAAGAAVAFAVPALLVSLFVLAGMWGNGGRVWWSGGLAYMAIPAAVLWTFAAGIAVRAVLAVCRQHRLDRWDVATAPAVTVPPPPPAPVTGRPLQHPAAGTARPQTHEPRPGIATLDPTAAPEPPRQRAETNKPAARLVRRTITTRRVRQR